jgi:ubiquinone/menaquinone biosynthesis C-methylase UbiE
MNDIELYEKRQKDFHSNLAKSPNPVRAWFHRFRQCAVKELVTESYKRGDTIVDVGCGNCLWNTDKLPVVGVDVAPNLVEYAVRKGRVSSPLICDITRIALRSECGDIVIAAEILEHISDYDDALVELRRVLKKGGKLVLTVPYDTFFSAWKPLFWLHCLLQGWVFGDHYFKQRCGHVHHFSPKKIRELLEKHDFLVLKQFTNFRFTIFTLAQKT